MTFPIATVDAAIISVLGEDITYTPNGGGATSIKAYWQSPNESPDTGEMEFELQGPRVHCLNSDVPNPSHLDQFTYSGVTYQVREIIKDEGALTELMLERV